MNKEDILAKSRQENKNRDIAGMDINKNASRISIAFSMFFILFLMLLTRIAGKHMNHGTAIGNSMNSQIYRHFSDEYF